MAYELGGTCEGATTLSTEESDYHFGLRLKEWLRDKPLSVLQLDPADRAVLRIAGRRNYIVCVKCSPGR